MATKSNRSVRFVRSPARSRSLHLMIVILVIIIMIFVSIFHFWNNCSCAFGDCWIAPNCLSILFCLLWLRHCVHTIWSGTFAMLQKKSIKIFSLCSPDSFRIYLDRTIVFFSPENPDEIHIFVFGGIRANWLFLCVFVVKFGFVIQNLWVNLNCSWCFFGWPNSRQFNWLESAKPIGHSEWKSVRGMYKLTCEWCNKWLPFPGGAVYWLPINYLKIRARCDSTTLCTDRLCLAQTQRCVSAVHFYWHPSSSFAHCSVEIARPTGENVQF